jgi:molecular chaperone Hsp33
MNNKDILQKFLFENAAVRGERVHLDHSFRTIMAQHNYPPVIQHILGEALAVACLLSATIKFKGRLSVQFQGKGKLSLLLAQCDQEFHLRGVARWDGLLSEDELLPALQQGVLSIMMDPVEGGQRYQGIVAWEGKSLAQSVEAYFRNSEQLPTRLWLAVGEESVAGLLLQVLPENTVNQMDAVTDNSTWEHLTILTDTITSDELLTLSSETLLHRLYSQEDVRLFEAEPVTFRCNCSIERSENAIRFLGRDEVEEELIEKQKLVVTCDFCSKEYTFDRVDVERIFKQGGQPPSSTQVQ